jgi:hypothetical protein
VRKPYGLHAIPAIIQTHASHKARGPIARKTSSWIPMRQPHPARIAICSLAHQSQNHSA